MKKLSRNQKGKKKRKGKGRNKTVEDGKKSTEPIRTSKLEKESTESPCPSTSSNNNSTPLRHSKSAKNTSTQQPEKNCDSRPKKYKIVNMPYMFEQARKISRHQPQHCDVKDIIPLEKREIGLFTEWIFICKSCCNKFSVDSEPLSPMIQNINQCAVRASFELGLGFSKMKMLFSSMQMSFMSEKFYENECKKFAQKHGQSVKKMRASYQAVNNLPDRAEKASSFINSLDPGTDDMQEWVVWSSINIGLKYNEMEKFFKILRMPFMSLDVYNRIFKRLAFRQAMKMANQGNNPKAESSSCSR